MSVIYGREAEKGNAEFPACQTNVLENGRCQVGYALPTKGNSYAGIVDVPNDDGYAFAIIAGFPAQENGQTLNLNAAVFVMSIRR